MIIYVYTDGASRNNPGESASGYAIYDKDHKPLFRYAFYNGVQTNNAAEYMAVIAALAKVAELYGYDNEIRAFSDSVLIVQQLKGKYKTKDKNLRELKEKALEYVRRFSTFTIKSLEREEEHIAQVDLALNELLDEQERSKRPPAPDKI